MNRVFKNISAPFAAVKRRRAARIVAVTAFLLTAVWCAEAAAQSVLRGPYLQLGTPTSIAPAKPGRAHAWQTSASGTRLAS